VRDVHEAASIAEALIADPANVDLSRHDLVFQAALQGYLQALLTTGQIVSEMAAEHARNGHGARAAALREATVQIASVPEGSAVRPGWSSPSSLPARWDRDSTHGPSQHVR
jgi:hypothetical protein